MSTPVLSPESYYLLHSGAVHGPYFGHRAGFLARAALAYDLETSVDMVELLTGTQLAADYAGKYGVLPADAGEVAPV